MNRLKKSGSVMRESAPYLGLGLQLAAAILVFYFIGAWADRKFGTEPWLMIAGVIVGAVGGFIQFFRTVSTLTRNDSSNNNDGSS